MKYIISAGGTGGHLYPALALAEYIKTQDKNSDFLFVGTLDRLEATIVPENGYKYMGLNVKGLTGNMVQKMKNILLFVRSIKKSKKIIKNYNPDIVIGFGGYPSASIVLAATKLHIPTIIHEQNSIIGLTNKILIKKVDKIICCYEKAYNDFPKEKTLLLGNPRASVMNNKELKDIYDIYKLDKDKKTIVIVMGSLGSSTINDIMVDTLKEIQNKNYNVIYVTGKPYYTEFLKKVGNLSSNIKIVPYIDDMPSVISSCDLIVSRAGASTLAEITAIGCPALLIPSPYVASNHQEFNARELVDKNAADMILEKDFSTDIFLNKIDSLLGDDGKINNMKINSKALGRINACEDFYKEILDLINIKH